MICGYFIQSCLIHGEEIFGRCYMQNFQCFLGNWKFANMLWVSVVNFLDDDFGYWWERYFGREMKMGKTDGKPEGEKEFSVRWW